MSRFLWTQKEDIGPAARFGHAMAYDSVRFRTATEEDWAHAEMKGAQVRYSLRP